MGDRGLRDALLQAAVVCGAIVITSTEALSTLSYLRRDALLVLWTPVGSLALLYFWRQKMWPGFLPKPDAALDPVVVLCIAVMLPIFGGTLLTAVLSPPNSADAMAYHMPRVLYWMEQSSVRFFPTPYLNQIMLQPFAEYCVLHLYLLAGTDTFTNLVQWVCERGQRGRCECDSPGDGRRRAGAGSGGTVLCDAAFRDPGQLRGEE